MTLSITSSLRLTVPLLAAVTVVLTAVEAHAEPGDEICFPLYRQAGAVPGTGMQCKLLAAAAPVGMGTYWCTGEPERIERYCGKVTEPPPPPQKYDNSTIECDGKGNYDVVNIDHSPSRTCTQIHEESHMRDWKERYGADSCKGQPRGALPMIPMKGDDYRDFLRDSECRAYDAEKDCVKTAKDGGNALRTYHAMNRKYYCDKYDSWRRPRKIRSTQ